MCIIPLHTLVRNDFWNFKMSSGCCPGLEISQTSVWSEDLWDVLEQQVWSVAAPPEFIGLKRSTGNVLVPDNFKGPVEFMPQWVGALLDAWGKPAAFWRGGQCFCSWGYFSYFWDICLISVISYLVNIGCKSDCFKQICLNKIFDWQLWI